LHEQLNCISKKIIALARVSETADARITERPDKRGFTVLMNFEIVFAAYRLQDSTIVCNKLRHSVSEKFSLQ
jgi:hypothetical protein